MNESNNNNQNNQPQRQRKQRDAGGAEGLSNYVFGKIQPQAIPLEEAVLGALMLDREALPMVMDILRPESFYLESHQHIYRAIIKLFERSNPVDLLTVTEELRKSGDLEKVGGGYYLVELSHRVASAANIEYHARIIAQKHIQRELIGVSTRTIRDAYEDTTDVFNLLDDAEKGLFAITQNNLSRSYESMGTLSSRVLKQIEELSGKTDGLTGVPTGFTNLDRLTSGWQPSDLVIIAARPGMGKTSLLLAMALNAAKDFGKPVAMFSLEMASTQLVQRLISMEAEIPGSKMRNGKLEDWEWQLLQTTVERLNAVPIFIDDTPAINIFELRAKCRRLKMQHDIQMIIIDYLQLMTGASENNRNANREQEIAGISRALKSLAKELKVPVIALSQLSRAVEVRGGSKRPQLSDLRECVTGDTRVALADGRYVPIKDLVGKQADVLSFDPETRKIVTRKTDLVWPVGEKTVYRIQLASGRSVQATAEHRLLGFPAWKTVAEMKPGDRIGIARRLPEPENPLAWKEEWKPGGMNAWLRELGIFNQHSHEKHLPDDIFQLSNAQVAIFLKHLWATDGTVFLNKRKSNTSPRLAFSTNSRRLAEDVSLLLSRFEIVARIRTVRQGSYRPMFAVEVSGRTHQMLFLKHIGIYGERFPIGEEIGLYHRERAANTNADTMPAEVFAHVKETMLEKGVSQRKMAALRGTSYGGAAHFNFAPSKAVLRQYAEILEDPYLKILSEDDLFWDTIVSIESEGEKQVYDLSVPGTESWLANGIVSHNSGAIEQDADIVSFIYRPEYYQILEDENGQSLKGIAEFIIAKHRHGALETIKLKFTDTFAKFGNLDDPAFAGLNDPLTGPFSPSVITMQSRMNEEDIPF